MSLNDSIVSLYKQKKLEKGDAYQLLSQLNALTASDEKSLETGQRKTTSFELAASRDEYLAFWCYLVSIIENQQEVVVAVIDEEVRRDIKISLQESDSLNDIIKRLESADVSADHASQKYLFSYHSGVDRGIAKACCILEGQVELEADADATGKTSFEDWPEFFQFLLPQMQEQPDCPINQLDLLPPKQKAVLETYNRSYTYLPPMRTLVDLLDPEMNRYLSSVAVQTSTESRTYGHLLENSNRLANLLRTLGALPNKMIPIICQRHVDMPMACYGIVLSGGAYVPLEPSNPADRIESILCDTDAEVIVTDAKTLREAKWQLAGSRVKNIVCLDNFEEKRYQGIRVYDGKHLAKQLTYRPSQVNKPDDLCYVIFTSGSTGKPKGVMISHLNIVNTLVGVNNLFQVNQSDRVFCFSSYGFDLSVWDIFGTLLAGATVFIPTHREIRDPTKLFQLLDEYQITIWDSVPTGMSQLLIPLRDAESTESVNSLRLAMLSGEFIPLGLPDNIRQFFPNCHVTSLGGATEGTVWSIHYPIDEVASHWKAIPYGYPLANQRYYVLNEAMQHCAIGQQGMLYIGGWGVAQGYFADPEKTEASFKPSPSWLDDPNDTIYKTGDLGLLNSDGVVEIVGRADSQIKIRGFRVELGEVETQFSGIEHIDQAAIIAKDDETTGKRLMAFYTSAKGELPAEVLRQELRAKLPEYMLPSQFIYLENPPVGLAGKLDRKALVNWQVSRKELSQTMVSAETEEEHKLVASLKSILNIDTLGVEDDFYLIGGDSLLALQYLSAINKLGYQATPGMIAEGRTIRKILALVGAADGQQVESVQARRTELSPMQFRYVHQLGLSERNQWNQSIDIEITTPLSVDRLNQALSKVIAHHPMLAAGLAEDSENHLQVVDPSAPQVEEVFLRRTNPFTRNRRIQTIIGRFQAQRDCQPEKLCGMMLIHLSSRRARLIWTIHHFSVDAHCWRVLLEDLTTAYEDPQATLSSTAVFSDYVAAVKANYPEELKLNHDAWSAIAARPSFELPKPSLSNCEADTQTYSLRLNKGQTNTLMTAVNANSQANLHLYTLTAACCALGKWAQTPNVAMDIISNGRDIEPSKDFSRTMGWFATHNHFDASLTEGYSATIEDIKGHWQSHQTLSRYFVEGCNRAMNDADHPLHGYRRNAVLYNFLGMYDNLTLPQGWGLRGNAGQDRGPSNERTHQLEIEVMVVNSQLMVNFHYSTQQFTRADVQRFAASLNDELKRLTEA